MKFNKKQIPNAIVTSIIEKYVVENKTISQIKSEIDFLMSPRFIAHILKMNNITIRNLPQKWNKSFFDNFNALNCYWAGFLFADGHIVDKGNTTGFAVKLSLKDLEHLNTFKKDLELENEVSIHNNTNSCLIKITQGDLAHKLLKFGLNINKTFEFIEPKIPNDLLPHFIRGWIDGDGTIKVTKHQERIKLVGNSFALKWLLKKLRELGYDGKALYYDIKTKTIDLPYGELIIASPKNILLFSKTVVYDSYPRLDRKWIKIDILKDLVETRCLQKTNNLESVKSNISITPKQKLNPIKRIKLTEEERKERQKLRNKDYKAKLRSLGINPYHYESRYINKSWRKSKS